LKGRYGCNKRDRSGLRKCVEYLERSLAADPEFAPSRAALAEALVAMALYAEAASAGSDAGRQKRGSYSLSQRFANLPVWGNSMALPLKTRSATILVLEDTVVVLNTVQTILQRANFTVPPASNADEAMRLAGSAAIIDLLLSDVMMPDMSGPDLALKLKELRPEMRVLLMSGYPGGGMLFLNYGWYFIEKPFVPVQLVVKVNEVLHGEMRDQGTDHYDMRV
jgi:CheY-like chemotaxis protein